MKGFAFKALLTYEDLVNVTVTPYSAVALLRAVQVVIETATDAEWLEFEDMRAEARVKLMDDLLAEDKDALDRAFPAKETCKARTAGSKLQLESLEDALEDAVVRQRWWRQQF